MAKPVMLEDERGYLMAVLPASRHIDLELMHRHTGRHLRLAREYEFAPMFRDCELGAVPPVGPAYGVETMIDDSLCREREIWFEAGDHERLVHMQGETFLAMLGSTRRAPISRMAH
jgi:Ala-tRNA(Pro) deacylase